MRPEARCAPRHPRLRQGYGEVSPELEERRRIGLRPENCTSGACLTKLPRLRFSVRLARIRVRSQLARTTVANHRLGRADRLRCSFRAYAPAWPHRAGERNVPPAVSSTTPR